MGTIVGHSFCSVKKCHRHASKNDPNITEQDWCFVAGTPVHLADGRISPIEEICIGDQVITHKGSSKPVLEVMSRNYSGELLSIQVYGNCSPVQCTPNHPFAVVKREKLLCLFDEKQLCRFGQLNLCEMKDCEGDKFHLESIDPSKIEFVQAGQLEEGDFVLFSLPEEKESDLSDDELRLIGWFAAEGSYLKKDGSVVGGEFALSKEEGQLAESIQKTISRCGADSYVYTHESGLRVRFKSQKLAALFFSHVGEYASTKSFNKIITLLPKRQAILVLNAFIDGDGHDNVKRNRVEITTVSRQLAYQLQLLMYRCGFSSNMICRDRRSETHSFNGRSIVYNELAYQIAFGSDGVRKLNRPIVQKEGARKGFGVSVICGGTVLRPIYSIERSEFSGKVYNLEVQDDNSYAVEFASVHNCHHLKYYKGQRDPDSGEHVYEDNRDIFGVECSWITIGAGADSEAKLQMRVAALSEQQKSGSLKIAHLSIVQMFAARRKHG